MFCKCVDFVVMLLKNEEMTWVWKKKGVFFFSLLLENGPEDKGEWKLLSDKY